MMCVAFEPYHDVASLRVPFIIDCLITDRMYTCSLKIPTCMLAILKPCESHVQALLLALRLWSKLPAELLSEMSLLPSDAKPPPIEFFSRGQGTAASAAAAVFSQQHLQKLLPVLRSTSSSHPRLHSVWPTLLALLLPGFTAIKVSHTFPSSAVAAFCTLSIDTSKYVYSHAGCSVLG